MQLLWQMGLDGLPESTWKVIYSVMHIMNE